MKMRKVCGALATFVAICVLSSSAFAEFKFGKTVTLINAWAPGSAIDAYAQQYVKLARKYVPDSNFVIEYKSGASGTVGMQYMRTRPSDGNTILITGMSSEISIATGSAKGVKPEDYRGIALLTGNQGSIAVQAKSEFRSVQDIIDYAKANPGKLRVGGTNTLSYVHFFALQLMKIAGISFNYIPYKNGGAANVALLGGNIDVCLAVPTLLLPYHQKGELRIVAQGFKEREMEKMPDIPSVYETPGLEFEKFGGEFMTTRMLVANADLPAEALEAWDKLTTQITSDPEWSAFVHNQGDRPMLMLSADCEKFTKGDIKRFAELYQQTAR